jgi:hypothetical protein
MIAALTLVGAAAFTAFPAAAQNVRDSVREGPPPPAQSSQSQMAAPSALEPRPITEGTVAVQQIPAGEAKASEFLPTLPALSTNAK